MGKNDKVSIYISLLLRHKPEQARLDMDEHGWVSTSQLIQGINENSKHEMNLERLQQIVAEDSKGRYRFNEDGSKIKACQGHSIPWVTPEVEYKEPPEFVYHGTTTEALEKIYKSGHIDKMKRHAVHMQATEEKAWQSALRWHIKPVVVKIAAGEMYKDGFALGITDNGVWCTEKVPVKYIVDTLYVR